MKPLPRLLLRTVLAFAALVLLATLAVWLLLRASLPRLEGELALPGLSGPVQVQRDALGVVSITAANETDMARALGYVHGQERFFEMDLLRRSAAGELSALFGPMAIERDKEIRVHRLRAQVEEQIEQFLGEDEAVLTAYAEGVNRGVHDLGSRPWAYWLLQTEPEPWQVADTALVGYAMFFDLQDESNSRELALWRIRQAVPEALYRLLAADGTEWDAPLLGEARGNVTLPTADELDLRQLPVPAEEGEHAESEPAAPGSNNFAVAGSRTADDRAIVANDMHLTLRAPSLWFRARLFYADPRAPGGKVDVTGFTLPGIPAVIVGSNGHVAWGFTNSYGDWLDFYRVDWANAERTRYRIPEGQDAVRTTTEVIRVKGGAPVQLLVRETRWGPIVSDEKDGSSLALRWTAHMPGALNLRLSDLSRAKTLDEALAVADTAGVPAQNLVLADSSGRIGWRLTGQIPDRRGECDMRSPYTYQTPCRWTGWVAPTENPSLVDPPDGRLWTANARTVDGSALALMGDAGFANGARAKQIRDGLRARETFSEADLLAIQLDDRSLFLQRWHGQLQALLKDRNEPALAELAAATQTLDARASTDAVSYRIVRGWRLAVIERILHGLYAPARAKLGEDFVAPDLPQIEGVAWQLLAQRPEHLLPRKFESWDALLLDAAREVHTQLAERGPLAQRSWGERNTAAICHPLAGALPGFVADYLCMPREPLAGDMNMPRVQSPTFGASERMVVSPGHEADGIVHMPGGQSGHLLSPFWGAGHAAWVNGEATPFLPGEAEYTLSLNP